MQKNSKNGIKNRKNYFFSKQPKIVLKYVPATLFVYVSG